MLFAIDLQEDFIDVESIVAALVFSLQSAGIDSPEFDTPEAARFAADYDTALGKQVFNILMAQVESVVEPNCVTDDVGRESVAKLQGSPT
jgi:hypothetical protein